MNSLDMLLLTFVDHGLATTYDMQSQAGLSAGLTHPALLRLKVAELVTCEDGPRRSVRYTLTEKGRDELRHALSPERIHDFLRLARFDAFHVAARVMFLAWLSYPPISGLDYVRWAIEDLQRRSSRSEEEARQCLLDIEHHVRTVKQGRVSTNGLVIAKTSLWMKTVLDAAEKRALSEVLEKMAPVLARMPSASLPTEEFLQAIQALIKDSDSQYKTVPANTR